MLRMDSSTDLVTASFRPWGVVHGLRLRTSRLGDDYILRELRLPHQRRKSSANYANFDDWTSFAAAVPQAYQVALYMGGVLQQSVDVQQLLLDIDWATLGQGEFHLPATSARASPHLEIDLPGHFGTR